MLTKSEIDDFEEDIAACYNRGEIKAPIHLDNNNIESLQKVFRRVLENDWVCCTWRNHAKNLMKGVNPEIMKKDILAGKSIGLSYKSHRTISSAIVGGIIPIALGIALANKLKKEDSRVWCFIGEHAAETGSFHESYNYSMAHDLNIMWVIEDNGFSVKTPTEYVWKTKLPTVIKNRNKKKYTQLYYDCMDLAKEMEDNWIYDEGNKLVYFKYKSKWPHSGGGSHVTFTF